MSQLRQIDSALLRFRRFVRRIAPYRPFSTGGHRLEAIHRQFVLCAAHENDGRLVTCTECQEICEKRWGSELERDEVSNAMRQLIEQGRLIQDSDGFRLSAKSSKELAERVRTSKEVETAAFKEWEAMVRRTEPSLTDRQVAELLEDLALWLQKFIVEYGIEAALVLYPEQPRFKERLEEIKALGLGFLPHRHSMVMKARPRALKAFIDYMTPMQRRHFDNLVVTAYLMSLFTLEPAALNEIRRLTNGQTLYLDTNVVYSLLKLNGARAYAVTRRILAHSYALGYRICVTPWTLREMEESVRKTRRRLARQPSPQALADIGVNASGSDGEGVIARAFRRMQRDTHISFDEFFVLHEQIQKLLELEGVEVVYDGCDAVTWDKRLFDEEIATLERLRDGPEKSRLVQEHDIKHRLLIELLRGEEAREPAKPGYLMLTNDHTLILYAREKRRRHKKGLPFAVSIHDWGNTVRSLVPRTKDYDETMIKILETLSFRVSGAVSQADVLDAIRRIQLQEEYTETIQAGFVVSNALGSDVDDADAKADAEPQPAPSEREATLESENRELRDQLDTVQRANDRLHAEVGNLRRALDEAPSAPERAGDGEWDSLNARIAQQDARIAQQDTRLAHQESTFRGVVMALIIFVGVVVVALPLSAGWIQSGWPLVGDICAGATFFAGASVRHFGFKHTFAVIAGLSAVLGIVGAIRAFVT
jgi:hypothetical protein